MPDNDRQQANDESAPLTRAFVLPGASQERRGRRRPRTESTPGATIPAPPPVAPGTGPLTGDSSTATPTRPASEDSSGSRVEPVVPESVVPEPVVPEPVVPEPVVPEPVVPEPVAPESAIPESAVPSSAVPEPATGDEAGTAPATAMTARSAPAPDKRAGAAVPLLHRLTRRQRNVALAAAATVLALVPFAFVSGEDDPPATAQNGAPVPVSSVWVGETQMVTIPSTSSSASSAATPQVAASTAAPASAGAKPAPTAKPADKNPSQKPVESAPPVQTPTTQAPATQAPATQAPTTQAPVPGPPAARNLALNAARETRTNGSGSNKAVDGNDTTQWTSSGSREQWIRIDLGSVRKVSSVLLKWGNDWPKYYLIQSGHTKDERVRRHEANKARNNVDLVKFQAGFECRYLEVWTDWTSGTADQISIREIEVIGQ